LSTVIAVCGSCFGTFAFAPLATMLLNNFSWQTSNLILAGMILSCGVGFLQLHFQTYYKSSSSKNWFLF